MACRSSVFSICYAHCSIPHRTSYWTACSRLLYIVDCLQSCCRVSVLGFYDLMCRNPQIGRRKLHQLCLSGNRLQCVGSGSTVGWCMTSRYWSVVLRNRGVFIWLEYGDNLGLSPYLGDLVSCEAYVEHCTPFIGLLTKML